LAYPTWSNSIAQSWVHSQSQRHQLSCFVHVVCVQTIMAAEDSVMTPQDLKADDDLAGATHTGTFAKRMRAGCKRLGCTACT
jgi:hypothetical protein